MKVCTQCLKEKENMEFPKRKTNKDGLYSWCKECCRKKAKKHALEHPEKIKATREKRKDKANKHSKIYKKLNAEKIAAQRKLYYEANAEEIKRKARENFRNLPEEKKEIKRQRDKIRHKLWRETEYGKNYYKVNWKERKNKYRKYYKATEKVQDAIRAGKLIRPETCSLCQSKGSIEGHHADYDKPLEVVWVCKKCHTMIHKNLKKGD